MSRTVTVEVDADRASLRVLDGRMFIGEQVTVVLERWTPSDATHRPVLTLFAPNSPVPLAQSTYSEGTLTLSLGGADLRKAFHGCAARHIFTLFINEQATADDGATWTWIPDVVAVGNVYVDWSPEVFEPASGSFSMATLQGPPGSNGQDGKSAYQLAVENGYTGTLQEWLVSINAGKALLGKSFDFSSANARKFADAIKMIFEALGGTVT